MRKRKSDITEVCESKKEKFEVKLTLHKKSDGQVKSNVTITTVPYQMYGSHLEVKPHELPDLIEELEWAYERYLETNNE